MDYLKIKELRHSAEAKRILDRQKEEKSVSNQPIYHSEEFVNNSLAHYGIKDQKWGVRRFQNPDGTLTAEGRKRYNKDWKDNLSEEDKNKLYDKKGNLKSDSTLAKEGILTKKDGKYYYKDQNGKSRELKTNINQLDDKELKDLKSRIDSENAIAKLESDQQKRDYDKELKKNTQGYKDAQDVFNDSIRLLDATSKALPTGNGKTVKKDYSYLTDAELKARITRLNLEDSYGKLTGETQYVRSGSEKAREYLQTVGSILGIAGTAAGLAYTITKIRTERKASHSIFESDNNTNSLAHYGIKDQKWGVRRFQNPDGTLTPEGKRRYKTNYGTKEVLKNTSNYDKLVPKRVKKQYTKYSEQSGAAKGFLAGLGIGAAAGIGKTVANVTLSSKKDKKWYKTSEVADNILARMAKNTIMGSLLGATVGTLVGKHIGKKSSEAVIADNGKKYVQNVLSTPLERLEAEQSKYNK